MAKEHEQPQSKSKKSKQVVVWILLGMLIVGLSGFGLTSFGGRAALIGQVGERKIDAARYARALGSIISSLSQQFGTQITFEQAQSIGADRQALQNVIAQAALENETARLSLSVGDMAVARTIAQIEAFQTLTGGFDPEMYRNALARANLSETTFENDERARLASQLLLEAVAPGLGASQEVADRLYAWAGEQRSFTVVRLDGTQGEIIANVPAPTEEQLRTYYQDNIADFTSPEAKRISYAVLFPEDIANEQMIDEARIRAAYDARADEFNTPATRRVERLVYPNQSEADAAKAQLDGGASFEELTAARGLSLEDTDLGVLGVDSFGTEGAAIFALDAPGIVGPLQTSLGPTIFRISALSDAQNISFDEARADVMYALQLNAAADVIASQFEAIDDTLARGATLEELVAEQGMRLGVQDVPLAGGSFEGLLAYPSFRDAAEALTVQDFPQAIRLENDGVIAARLDEIVPATTKPFAEARAAVLKAWTAAETDKAVSEHAQQVAARLAQGGALEDFGTVATYTNITRTAAIPGAPQDLLARVFAMQLGEAQPFRSGGFTGVLLLDDIARAAQNTREAVQLKQAITSQIAQLTAQDTTTLFTNALIRSAGVTLDQTVINAVNANFN